MTRSNGSALHLLYDRVSARVSRESYRDVIKKKREREREREGEKNRIKGVGTKRAGRKYTR